MASASGSARRRDVFTVDPAGNDDAGRPALTIFCGHFRTCYDVVSHSGSASAVSLQWLLFDFGQRAALVDAAKQGSVIANIAFTRIADVSGRKLSSAMIAPVESVISDALARRPDVQSA